MLTPRDIEKKSFSHTRNNGYKTEEVEDFLEEIIADYSMLIEERENLSNRVLSLSDKLENIRDEQEVWKKTLMNTQKSYDEIIDSAKEKADAIIREANAKAVSITSSASAEAIEIKSKINDLIAHKNALAAEVEKFKNSLLSSYEAHIKIIQTIPTLAKEEIPNIDIPVVSGMDINIPAEPAAESKTESEQEKISSEPQPLTAEKSVDAAQAPVSVSDQLEATMVVPSIKDFDKDENSTEQGASAQRTVKLHDFASEDSDDDDDILVSRTARPVRARSQAAQQETLSREEKLRNLFAEEPAQDKKKNKKTKNKISRFFVDDDDLEDDDFDDED